MKFKVIISSPPEQKETIGHENNTSETMLQNKISWKYGPLSLFFLNSNFFLNKTKAKCSEAWINAS